MVEFALILPLVVLVLLAAVETVLVARTQLEVVNAAREGAREAATAPDPAQAASVVRRVLGPRGADARIQVSRPHVVGGRAVVTVAVPHRVAVPVFGGFAVTLTGRAEMRVER